jgi:hypothetical protein
MDYNQRFIIINFNESANIPDIKPDVINPRLKLNAIKLEIKTYTRCTTCDINGTRCKTKELS